MFCSFGMTLTSHGLIAINPIKGDVVAFTGMTLVIAINSIKGILCPSGFTDGGEFGIMKVRLMNGSRSAQSRVSSSAFVGFSLPQKVNCRAS